MTAMPLLALAAVLARAQAAPPRTSVYLVPWDELSAGALGDCVGELDPFVYAFDHRYRPFLAYPELLARVLEARRDGTRVVPVIVNDVLGRGGSRLENAKSVDALTRILNSDKASHQHLEELLAIALIDGADGLELDYEKVPPALYGRYADLVEALAKELHARGKTLSVDLEPGPLVIEKERDIAEKQWPRIAAAADQVKLMMYYERGDFSYKAGPGTSLAWLADNGRKALSYIPAAKLSLAISLAGTDWTTPFPGARRAERLHYGQVAQLARRTGSRIAWSDEWSAPVFHYQERGRDHEVWFENERSLSEKIAAAQDEGAGVALWYLGAEHPDVSRLGLCRP